MSIHTAIDVSLAAPPCRLLYDRLNDGLAVKMRPVFADIHEEILVFAGERNEFDEARRHAKLLVQYCNTQRDTISAMLNAEQQFQSRQSHAVDSAEERAAILDFAHALGAERKALRSDRKAFDAYFDGDAIIERFRKRLGERERALAHAVERLGLIAADAVAFDPMIVDTSFFVELFDELLDDMRNWSGDARVRCASHKCLAAIALMIGRWPFGAWFENLLSTTRRVCLDETENVWVQCAAFDALLSLSPQSIGTAISARIKQPLSRKSLPIADNEMFLRRHLVGLLCANYSRDKAFAKIVSQLAGDKSGAVRQAFAAKIHLLPKQDVPALFTRLRLDHDPQVRAAIFADVPQMLLAFAPTAYAKHITRILKYDSDEFVLRVALDAASSLVRICRETNDAAIDRVIAETNAGIMAFQGRRLSPKLLRWADEATERVWLMSDLDAIEMAGAIQMVTQGQLETKIRPAKALKPWLAKDHDMVGRVLAVLAQNDFGLSLKAGRRPQIQRGEWIKRRFWRILYEGRNPSTDKRQAHIHTTGRHYFGTLLAPSARMAELAPTKVPGEPLFESKEGGWRNYLPLVDQVLAAIDSGKELKIFTSAGVTTLTPPGGIYIRARLFVRISRGFSDLANLRNREPRDYLARLRGFGIETAFRSHEEGRPANPEIAKFFWTSHVSDTEEAA